jgi:hypothetical protein
MAFFLLNKSSDILDILESYGFSFGTRILFRLESKEMNQAIQGIYLDSKKIDQSRVLRGWRQAK